MNRILLLLATVLIFSGCSIKYSFTGASISDAVKTVSIQNFPNMATMVNPSLSSTFQQALQDKFSRQTRLMLVREDGDMNFEGEITNYVSSPIAVTGNEYASMNRLTIVVKVRYTNKIDPVDNYDKSFTAYADYDSNKLLQEVESTLVAEIVEKLVEDIFNAAVSKW